MRSLWEQRSAKQEGSCDGNRANLKNVLGYGAPIPLREDRKTTPCIYGPYETYDPAFHGEPLSSHVEAEWTSPGHWSHDNYQRGHLPQLCIRASGWKAKLLAWLIGVK